MATSACRSPGVHTSTSWTSSRLTRACQSVSAAAQPSRARRGVHGGRVPAAQHGHGGLQRQVEHVRRGPPGLRVGRAHERVADHAHAEQRAARDLTRCLLHLGASPSGRYWGAGLRVPGGVQRLGRAEDRAHRLERALPADRSIASIISSTCSASSPEARGAAAPRGRGPCRARRARARPPRPGGDDGPVAVAGAADADSPSNRFGSGTASVASVPVISTKPVRRSGESQLSTQRRRLAAGVFDECGDVGGHRDAERGSRARARADDARTRAPGGRRRRPAARGRKHRGSTDR